MLGGAAHAIGGPQSRKDKLRARSSNGGIGTGIHFKCLVPCFRNTVHALCVLSAGHQIAHFNTHAFGKCICDRRKAVLFHIFLEHNANGFSNNGINHLALVHLMADGMAYSLVLNHPLSNPNHNLPINWRASLFGDGTPGAAPGPSGPTGSAAAALADSDSDGISDLMEYATGTIGNNGGSQHPPVTGRITAVVPPALEAEEFLTYAYTRSRGADGFSFEPEVSTLLTGWQPLSALFTFIGQTNNGDGTATMTWRSTAPVSTLPGRIFLQVRAGISP